MSRSPLIVSVLQILCVLGALVGVATLGGWLTLRFAVSGTEVRVPDVIGLPLEEAQARLAELGIQARVDSLRLPEPDLPADAVARQEPGPGTPLKRMRRVHLMLARGPVNRELPDLVGDYAQRTRIALEQQDISVDYEAAVFSRAVERDRIIASEPQPPELPPGSTAAVRLLKSLGPKPRVYVMVDLIGLPVERVRSFLERHGFRIGRVLTRRYPSVRPGTVVSHNPAHGFQVMAGAEISLEVSG